MNPVGLMLFIQNCAGGRNEQTKIRWPEGDEGTKVIGWILLVLGIIFWIYIGVTSGR